MDVSWLLSREFVRKGQKDLERTVVAIPCGAIANARTCLRRKTNFANRFKVFALFKLLLENISLFQKPKSAVCPRRPAFLSEGRLAIVTDVGGGMRWTRWCRWTSGTDAYGEDAWS